MNGKYGERFKIEISGSSHSPEMTVVIEGVKAGFKIDSKELQEYLDRRAPGRDEFSTPRKEADIPVFDSGVVDGVTDGGVIKVTIKNTNTRSGDYENDIPRPGHADWPARVKYGESYRFAGGGHFSGRLTAMMCVAGGMAKQLLRTRGISVSARAVKIAGETELEKMQDAILLAKREGDSVGGIIECVVSGVGVGLGDHIFGGIENRISAAVFGIPAVKGIEFGEGFKSADLRGSENNDEYGVVDGKIKPLTNHSGGILGGLSTGEDIVFRVAMKPTPSISKPQRSVNLKSKQATTLVVRGRHDPCVVFRAVPCVEAAAAIAIADIVLGELDC